MPSRQGVAFSGPSFFACFVEFNHLVGVINRRLSLVLDTDEIRDTDYGASLVPENIGCVRASDINRGAHAVCILASLFRIVRAAR